MIVRANDRASRRQCRAFNSFFFPELEDKGYSGVERWTKRADIFSYDLLLVPVHTGVHWCAGVVDLKNKQLE